MKAKYKTKIMDCTNTFEFPVVVAQTMEHIDGFTLLGYDSWEAVQREDVIAAVTGVVYFYIEKQSIGFTKNDKD